MPVFRRCLSRFALINAMIFSLASGWAHAELLPQQELQDCDVHVVGIYEPKDHSKDDRVYVKVAKLERPAVIVLTSYFETQWNVEILDPESVRQVIVSGYFKQSAKTNSDATPTEIISYFPKAEKSKGDYFWSYSWHTQRGRELRQRVKELTGLDVTTFQGEYAQSHFEIDGQRGQIDDSPRPKQASSALAQITQQVDLKRADELRKKEELKRLTAIAQQASAARIQREQLANQYGPNHPLVKQIEQVIKSVNSELKRFGNYPEAASLTKAPGNQTPKDDVDPADEGQVIESLVRKSFDLETQLLIARIEKAEADLDRVKAQLKTRVASSEKLIQARIDELAKKTKSIKGQSQLDLDYVDATSLATDGWTDWRQAKLTDAIAKFQRSLALAPDNETALNGLGWSYTRTGQFDKAIEIFRKILAKAPYHPAALNGLGQCLLAQGKHAEAEKEFLQTVNQLIDKYGEETVVNRNMTAAWHGLVRNYIAMGKHDEARSWIKRYLKHDPDQSMMTKMLQEVESQAGAR